MFKHLSFELQQVLLRLLALDLNEQLSIENDLVGEGLELVHKVGVLVVHHHFLRIDVGEEILEKWLALGGEHPELVLKAAALSKNLL